MNMQPVFSLNVTDVDSTEMFYRCSYWEETIPEKKTPNKHKNYILFCLHLSFENESIKDQRSLKCCSHIVGTKF